jgi:hypothetical protein
MSMGEGAHINAARMAQISTRHVDSRGMRGEDRMDFMVSENEKV